MGAICLKCEKFSGKYRLPGGRLGATLDARNENSRPPKDTPRRTAGDGPSRQLPAKHFPDGDRVIPVAWAKKNSPDSLSIATVIKEDRREMLLTTKISPRFLWRLGLLAFFFLGISLWFLYDAVVTYPPLAERTRAYEELEEQREEGILDDDDFNARWEAITRERGWPPEHLPKDKHERKDDGNVLAQYVFSCLVAPFGLLYVFLFFRSRRRWIELNETGLRTSWGQQLEFGQITTLNKRLWRNKGIAKITYEQNGRKRRLALDDWKYDAETTKAVLCELESRIDVQKIVGGAPEAASQETQEEPDSADDPKTT